jgi:hypothetical protein
MGGRVSLPSDEVLMFLVSSEEACFDYLFHLPFLFSSYNVWGQL